MGLIFQASVPMVSGDRCSAAYSGVNVEIGDNKVSRRREREG